MSANATTAMHGQSTSAGPLGAAAVLTAVVAIGALGFMIGSGVRTTTVDAPVAGPVIDSTSMSGPRTGVQKGLGNDRAAIAATKDAGASIVLPAAAAYSGTAFAGQYEQWVKAQSAAASSDFPDLYQRLVAEKGLSPREVQALRSAWEKVHRAREILEANAV